MKSYVTSMALGGLIGKMVTGNIQSWQIDAYPRNKNIINQIIWANSKAPEQNPRKENNFLPWYGEFVGKLLTGMAYCYRISPSVELKAAIEMIISDLKGAQGDDGYIGVFAGSARFALEADNWDLWNHYHAIMGLLEWYGQTEDRDALAIAEKAIECVYYVFKDRSYLVKGGFETNRAIAHAYARMYEMTREKKYLDEAERIIITDCQDEKGWYKTALNGGHFFESSSNRWEVLHMIMPLSILYRETKKQEYYYVMAKIWADIAKCDIHNNGGFTTNERALGDPYMEGVIETCCSIAWEAFSNEFWKLEKSVKASDEIEKTYYNAILSTLVDSLRECTYNTPMNGYRRSSGGYDGRRVPSQQDISFQYNECSPDMNCCQANIARGIGQLVEWACVSEENEIYLNFYAESEIKTKVNGVRLTLTQKTKYPLDGNIILTLSELEKETAFKLKLRIPSWADGSFIISDGKKIMAEAGEYFTLDRSWKNGDTVDIFIAEKLRFEEGKDDQEGFTSISYGPLLLCLDGYFNKDIDLKAPIARQDIENGKISDGAPCGALMKLTFVSDGKNLTLTDFMSSGKYRAQREPSDYRSWVRVI